MADAVLLGHFLRLVQLTADDRRDLHAVDQLQGVQVLLAEQAGLTIRQGAVEDLALDSTGRLYGVRTAAGEEIGCRAAILTTGTFLRGLIHIGEAQTAAGRVGEAPALGLSATLRRLGFPLGRLKTGTPPRLDGGTIDWSGLEMQAGDDPPAHANA